MAIRARRINRPASARAPFHDAPPAVPPPGAAIVGDADPCVHGIRNLGKWVISFRPSFGHTAAKADFTLHARWQLEIAHRRPTLLWRIV